MWKRLVAGHPTRTLALALCIGVVLGGSLPELGNLAQYYFPSVSGWGLNFREHTSEGHWANGYFLVAGILGVIICGIALVRRRGMETTYRMVNKKEDTNE